MAKCKINQRKRRGKCIPRKGYFKFFNRKTKNPFKMIGSYIGAIIAFMSISTTIPQTILGFFKLDQILVIPLQDSIRFVFMAGGVRITFGILIVTIIGFLLGYAIQLILRLFRK